MRVHVRGTVAALVALAATVTVTTPGRVAEAASAPVPADVHAAATAIAEISAGGVHTLVADTYGGVWAFGYNYYGALGTGTNLNTTLPNPTPTKVPGIKEAADVAAGAMFSLVRTYGGEVWSFGNNVNGQLGRPDHAGQYAPNPEPQLVPGLSLVKAVAAGDSHSVALRVDGTVWTFGDNAEGELGQSTNVGTQTPNAVPAPVSGLSDVTAISAGSFLTLALRSDGTVWSFGRNSRGQLGVNTNLDDPHPVATQVPGLSDITAIAAGADHSLALKSDGTVWSFGNNAFGQLGRSTNAGVDAANPDAAVVPGLTGVIAIAAGNGHSLAMKADDSVSAWGYNPYNQLGTGSTDVANATPTLSPELSGAATIAGAWRSFAVFGTGSVAGLGYNFFGELGTTTNAGAVVRTEHSLPVSIPVRSRFVATPAARVLDTRLSGTRPVAGTTVTVPAGPGLDPAPTAVVVNVTATEATDVGFVQAFPAGESPGSTSTLNIERTGQTLSNWAIVPVGENGSISVYTQSGAHLIVDVLGYFVPTDVAVTAGRVKGLVGSRLYDTRNGAIKVGTAGRETLRLTVAGYGGVPTSGVAAAVLNLTATESDGPGYLQAGGADLVRGAWSNVNVERAGQTIANQVIVPLDSDGSFTVYAQVPTHVIVDIVGYITNDAAPAGDDGLFVATSPSRVLDTRPATRVGTTIDGPLEGGPIGVDTRAFGPVSAVAANITVTEATFPGFVQAGFAMPGTSSTLNFVPGQTIAHGTITAPGREMYLTMAGRAHLLVDVVGWFTG
ncbi:MAG: RCC1 domain-containing protein [Acidimicrobiia bacterium]